LVATVHGQVFTETADAHFGSTLYDAYRSIIPTLDGGYLLVGETSGSNQDVQGATYGLSDYWVIKLDHNYNLIWEKNYGGSGTDGAMGVVQTDANTYYIIGNSDSPANGSKTVATNGGNDIWIVKIDNTGTQLADYSYGTHQHDYCYRNSICLNNANNLIIAAQAVSEVSGNKTSPGFGITDIWVLEIDQNGVILKERSFGGAASDDSPSLFYDSITENYFLASKSSSDIGGNKTSEHYGSGSDVWVLKLSDSLEIVAQNSFGGTDYESVGQISLMNNQIVVCGTSQSPISGNKTCASYGPYDGFLIVLDSTDLNIQEQESFGGTSNNTYFTGVQQIENHIFCFGSVNGPSNDFKTNATYGQMDGYMVLLDMQYNYLDNTTFGGTTYDGDPIGIYENGIMNIFFNSNSPSFSGSLNCSNYGSSDIIHGIFNSDLGIASNDIELVMYPNPSNGIVYFKGITDGQEVSILNHLGQTVQKGIISNNTLNVQGLASGNYFLEMNGAIVKFNKE
jgi:hypothetical protein